MPGAAVLLPPCALGAEAELGLSDLRATLAALHTVHWWAQVGAMDLLCWDRVVLVLPVCVHTATRAAEPRDVGMCFTRAWAGRVRVAARSCPSDAGARLAVSPPARRAAGQCSPKAPSLGAWLGLRGQRSHDRCVWWVLVLPLRSGAGAELSGEQSHRPAAGSTGAPD